MIYLFNIFRMLIIQQQPQKKFQQKLLCEVLQ